MTFSRQFAAFFSRPQTFMNAAPRRSYSLPTSFGYGEKGILITGGTRGCRQAKLDEILAGDSYRYTYTAAYEGSHAGQEQIAVIFTSGIKSDFNGMTFKQARALILNDKKNAYVEDVTVKPIPVVPRRPW